MLYCNARNLELVAALPRKHVDAHNAVCMLADRKVRSLQQAMSPRGCRVHVERLARAPSQAGDFCDTPAVVALRVHQVNVGAHVGRCTLKRRVDLDLHDRVLAVRHVPWLELQIAALATVVRHHLETVQLGDIQTRQRVVALLVGLLGGSCPKVAFAHLSKVERIARLHALQLFPSSFLAHRLCGLCCIIKRNSVASRLVNNGRLLMHRRWQRAFFRRHARALGLRPHADLSLHHDKVVHQQVGYKQLSVAGHAAKAIWMMQGRI
mmetsp:Transcript_31524/g.93998  ORF Transcript_31524/g.93998 Transcript_31524/m.93998 type:complete len:265 (+) Transcript_31524:263-1057(+)